MWRATSRVPRGNLVDIILCHKGVVGGEGTSIAGGLLIAEGPEVNALGLCHHGDVGHRPPNNTKLVFKKRFVVECFGFTSARVSRRVRTTSVTSSAFNVRATTAAPSILLWCALVAAIL